jgi:hypothetical protein
MVIRDCDKGTTIAFLIHICEVDRVKKRSTVHQYYLRFKMLFNRENGRHMDTNDAKEALAVRALLFVKDANVYFVHLR